MQKVYNDIFKNVHSKNTYSYRYMKQVVVYLTAEITIIKTKQTKLKAIDQLFLQK